MGARAVLEGIRSSLMHIVVASMFTGAANVLITGGSFTNTSDGSSLTVLHKRVAPHAILNAGGRADEVRCHPGTRVEVISRIEKWADAKEGKTAPVFWLSGPAGAGKSAIVQTVAERYKERGVPQPNFFFFRADATRSSAFPLVATLLHQIVLLYPSLRDTIATVLATNPLLFDTPLEEQLEQIIVAPLRSIQQASSAYHPLLFLVDGLDECDSENKRDQQRILHAFDQALREPSCPFRLLIASRDESQIRTAFNKISSQCLQLYLDEKYSPDNDIRVFVRAQFEEVRKTHPLAHTLDAAWPPLEDINYIVDKSSGQFIYAATVMRFISDSAASPMLSLERVKGAARLATKSPFSQLDAIYTYILSQADDQDMLKDLLCAHLSLRQVQVGRWDTNTDTQIELMSLLGVIDQRYHPPIFVVSCLADLTPLARFRQDISKMSYKLVFYHASFSDYLEDPSRSGDYFVDMPAFSYRILPLVWKFVQRSYVHTSWQQFCFDCIEHLQEFPPGFMKMMTTINHRDPFASLKESSTLQIIYNLCTCDDDMERFRRIFYTWVSSRSMDKFKFEDIKDIRFGCRYYQMARAEHYLLPLDGEMGAALRPETEFDRHESSLWLRDLLLAAHRKRWLKAAEHYKQLLTTWIPWAIENDIPCDALKNVPGAGQYIPSHMVVLEDVPGAQKFTRGSTMKDWFAQMFRFMICSSEK